MTIHKEGRRLLFVLLLVLSAGYFGVDWLSSGQETVTTLYIIVALVVYLLVLQFFRLPKISVKNNESHILAPAEGKVVVIEEAIEDEYLKEKRKQISIFMSPLNVHVNRMPASGSVKFFKYHPGKYLVAWHPKSSTENERTTMVVATKKGPDVLVRQIAGAVARRIKWYVKEGQQLAQGDEFGFIKFGSRVDIFLPLDADIKVKIGDKTKGGETVLAVLK